MSEIRNIRLQFKNVELTQIASLLTSKMSEHCVKGRGSNYKKDQIKYWLNGYEHQEIDGAVRELGSLGLISIKDVIGGWLFVSTTPDFYLETDHYTIGSNVFQDAHIVINAMVGSCLSNMRDVHKESKLPIRNFNSALTLIKCHITDSLISQKISPDYWISQIQLGQNDALRLPQIYPSLE